MKLIQLIAVATLAGGSVADAQTQSDAGNGGGTRATVTNHTTSKK